MCQLNQGVINLLNPVSVFILYMANLPNKGGWHFEVLHYGCGFGQFFLIVLTTLGF